MLINLKYVPHELDNFQKSIDFIFFKVWCKAKHHKNFSLDLLNEQTEFKNYILEVKRKSKKKDYFLKPLENIFNLFKTLSDSDISKLQKGYQNNNYRISEMCQNKILATPLTFKDLESINKDLSIELKNFFADLYNNVLPLTTTEKYYGGLLSHHNTFKEENRLAFCPFCGLSPIIGTTIEKKRNAYDHYLPKSKYIFNSVNPKNLAPICDACNKTYKGQKNPLENKLSVKRKAFYPFMKKYPGININIDKITSNRNGIEKCKFSFESKNYQEEIETWNEVFEIATRYNDFLVTSDYPKMWIEKFRQYKESNTLHTKDDYISFLTRINNHNFLIYNVLEIAFIKRYRI